MKMRTTATLVAVVVTSLLAGAARADLVVSGLIASQANGPNFDYTIRLTNSGSSTSPVETFWYAWVPGKDFLTTSPVSVAVPAGWTETITHVPNTPTNGYAIQWVTSTAPLAPGGSLDFKFTSADTPASVFGNSVYYPGTPVGTSFVYSGAPFQGLSSQFVVTAVPEPSSLALFAAVALAACAYRGARRTLARRAARVRPGHATPVEA
jgi:hypothetical protein